jgi:hypothetical protein
MAIYVGPIKNSRPDSTWPFDTFCRMFSDENIEDEISLHKIARDLRLKDQWFHPEVKPNFYYLNLSMRKKALELGAVSLNKDELWRKIRNPGVKSPDDIQ